MTDGFGYDSNASGEQQSLVGPPASADQQGQMGLGSPDQQSHVGLPQLTYEEQQILHLKLMEKKELGLYTNEMLMAGIMSAEDQERQAPVRTKTGLWVRPGDPDYDAAKEAADKRDQQIAAEAVFGLAMLEPGLGREGEFNAKSLEGVLAEKNELLKTRQDDKEHDKIEAEVKNMVAQDAGSADKHEHAGQTALRDIRDGISTNALRDLRGKMAAVTGTAFAGVEDINPERLGQMHADPLVKGDGASKAYAEAQRSKQERNAAFSKHMEIQKIKDA